MQYNREYKGLNIQIEGAWSEENQSNLYTWRVVHYQRVIPLEGKRPFREWLGAYNDATAAIDRFTATFHGRITGAIAREIESRFVEKITSKL